MRIRKLHSGFLIGMVLLMLACSRDKIEASEEIIVLGHGGIGWPTVFKNYPMNSQEAIEKALEEEQADGVEVDVQMTEDSVLVLFHDGKLESGSDCEGCIVEQNAATVLDCHHKKVLWGAPEEEFNIIGLEAMLDEFYDEADPPWLSLDLKVQSFGTDHPAYLNRFARQLVDLFTDKPYTDRVIFESQDLELLTAIHALAPDLLIYANFGEVGTLLADNQFETEYDWLDGVVITLHNISQEEVTQLHDLGLKVSVFGVKLSGDVREGAEKGVDMMQVEKISMTRETLGK